MTSRGIKLRKHDEVAIILRLREFDRFARDFLNRCRDEPSSISVLSRNALPTCRQWLVERDDLDLPEVVDLRRQLIGGEGERYHLLAGSVFDRAWLDAVGMHRPRPFLFMAEAVLMYFEDAQVKRSAPTLRERFPGAELVCDAATPLMVRLDNLHLVLTPVRGGCTGDWRTAKTSKRGARGSACLRSGFTLSVPSPAWAPCK